jgi:hypothetical protein
MYAVSREEKVCELTDGLTVKVFIELKVDVNWTSFLVDK